MTVEDFGRGRLIQHLVLGVSLSSLARTRPAWAADPPITPFPLAQQFLDFTAGARGREVLVALGVLVP